MTGGGGRHHRSEATGRFVTKGAAARNAAGTADETREGTPTRGAGGSPVTRGSAGHRIATNRPEATTPPTTATRERDGSTGRFSLGADGIERLNAIEGIVLSTESRAMFSDFDRRNLSPEDRRAAIISRHARKG